MGVATGEELTLINPLLSILFKYSVANSQRLASEDVFR